MRTLRRVGVPSSSMVSEPRSSVERAVVDHGHARRRDALADAARESRRPFPVEVALKAVTDRFVEQYAGPTWTEHDRHLAGRRSDRIRD